MGLLGDIWEALPQLVTADFWHRIVTRPFEAVRQMPDVAIKSGLVAGAAVATGGLALKAAPVVFGAAKAAAAPATFVARHPVLSYLLVTQSDLPTEVVRTVGQIYAAPTQAAMAAPTAGQAGAVPVLPATVQPPRPHVTSLAPRLEFSALRGAPGLPTNQVFWQAFAR